MELRTAGLILIRDRKLLLAFSINKECYYLPGGKLDDEENARTALCREIREELNIEIREDELIFYTHISAPAFGERDGIVMEQDCFFLNRAAEPVASAEILKLHWFTLAEYLEEKNQAPGAIQVLELLTRDRLID